MARRERRISLQKSSTIPLCSSPWLLRPSKPVKRLPLRLWEKRVNMSDQTQKVGAEAPVAVATGDEFASLLRKEFKPQTERAREEVETAVMTLAREALDSSAVVGSDAVVSIQNIIAEIDKKLSAQINEILHHEDFQALEGSWRGLHYLVN